MTDLRVELEREVDGRWIADYPAIPGATVYGDSIPDALRKLALVLEEILADLEPN
jgi:predicted RNase H-like HicB family nuclease